MATDQRLVKDWIQFLKNNQIVSSESDKSGKLQYRKKVTVDVVSRFLGGTNDFTPEQIDGAIQQVLSKKGGAEPTTSLGADGSGGSGKSDDLGEPTTSLGADGSGGSGNKNSKLSQTPGAVRKREQRTASTQKNKAGAGAFGQMAQQLQKNGADASEELDGAKQWAQYLNSKKKGLKEEIRDLSGAELDEKDIEEIFNLLGASSAETQQATPSSKDDTAEKVDKLKNLIRSDMTPVQRKALFTALSESVIFEEYVDKNDAAEILKYAASLKKGRIDINDLQKAWQAGIPQKGIKPFSDDTGDISQLLRLKGYDIQEINNVFDRVLGPADAEDDSEETGDPTASPAAVKIADYIKKNNLKDEIVAFLQQEFADDLADEPQPEPEKKPGIFKRAVNFGKKMFGRKATTEEIRQIFINILKEERHNRLQLMQQIEKIQLGRNRKQLDEVVSLNDVLKADSFVRLMKSINTKIGSDINATRIKNQVLQSWSKGMKSRKHYDDLLKQINLNLNDLIK